MDRPHLGAIPSSLGTEEATMATVVFLLDGGDVAISSSLASDLAQLGVTSISICRDDTTVGIVLEGWAFDRASAGEAARCLASDLTSGRVLHPTVQMALLGLRT